MSLTLAQTATLDFVPRMLWYSERSEGFVAGDERTACLSPVVDFATPAKLAPALPYDPAFPYRLPLPEELQNEFAAMPWHGFEFLSPSEYDRAVDEAGRRVGSLTLTLGFGPDYGLYVRHRPSGLILSLRAGSLELLRRTDAGFEAVDSTRTRGRAALCFAAHPKAPRIAYGDNYGNFHLHDFSDAGFGKASKLDAKLRKASEVEFIDDGEALLVGGMGYLSLYRSAGRKWSLQCETTAAVRSFLWIRSSRLVIVNQGMHGISRYAIGEAGFEKVDSISNLPPIDRIAASPSGDLVAASLLQSGQVALISAS